MDNTYFATKPAKELVSYLEQKLTSWSEHSRSVGLIDKQQMSYNYYYGNHFKNASSGGTAIKSGGKKGELKLVAANHYRNLLRHILVMTTSQKPAFDARAKNTDLKSLQQARLGNNILDGYIRDKRLGRYLKRAGETGLVLGKGFVECVWEPSLGQPYSKMMIPNEYGEPVEKIVYEGDVDLTSLFPNQVYVDPDLDDFGKAEYVNVKKWKNKYNLAARYPDMADSIMKLPTKRDLYRDQFGLFYGNEESESLVCVNAFYHTRTEAARNGRYVLYGDSNSIMYDGPIPYSRLPVFRLVPGEIIGTTEGYTDGFDLLTLQEVIDSLLSAAFTNQNANAVQKLYVPDGCSVSTELLSQGLIIIKGPQGQQPVPLQLTATAPEIFTLLQLAERYAETISGINSVARGNPESSLKSGVALSMVQSMAIQFSSGFQESWVELLEDLGTFILVDCLCPFAKTKRMAAMAGKHNRGAMKAYAGEDLEGISRVVVDMGNPLTRTTAGKLEIADKLLDKGLIKTPQEYFNVLNTGTLEPLIQGPQAEIDRIRSENEALMDGKVVKTLVTDSHLLDMQEHRTVINDPSIREMALAGDVDAQTVVANTLAHIQEHMTLYKTQDPLWSMVAGEPPAPQPPPMPMMPPDQLGGPVPPNPEEQPPLPPAPGMPPSPPAPTDGTLPGSPAIQ